MFSETDSFKHTLTQRTKILRLSKT